MKIYIMRDIHYYSNIADLFQCLFIDTSSEFDYKTIMNITSLFKKFLQDFGNKIQMYTGV